MHTQCDTPCTPLHASALDAPRCNLRTLRTLCTLRTLRTCFTLHIHSNRRCWRAVAAAARRRRRRRRTRSSPRARRPGGATRAGREEPRGCDSVSTRLSCLIGLRKATASIGFTRCGKHQRPEIVGVALSALCGLTLSARCGVRECAACAHACGAAPRRRCPRRAARAADW